MTIFKKQKPKRTIKVTPNYSNRTFTIRKYEDEKVYAKYRTSLMTKDEFESCEYHTNKDWLNFLRYSQDYYKV